MSSGVLICNSCGNSRSSISKVCSSCGFDPHKHMVGSSMAPIHQATRASIKDRMGVLAGWFYNKVVVGCNAGQDWSEYEQDCSENGSSDEYSRYKTDAEYMRWYPRKYVPVKQSPVPLELDRDLLSTSDDLRRSLSSSTRDSWSLSNNFPSPASYLQRNDRRDAEIQTDTSVVLTKSTGSKQIQTTQDSEQQAPFLYRLVQDEAKPKKIYIKRTRGSYKYSNNLQMTRSSPAVLFESFRKEPEQKFRKFQESLQTEKLKSHHQQIAYEREQYLRAQQISKERSSYRNSNQKINLAPRTTETQLNSVTNQILLSESIRASFRALFTIFAATLLCFITYSIFEIYRTDISKKESSKLLELNREASECRRKYIENDCEASKRIRALEGFCVELIGCMNKDPSKEVLKTHIIAELLSGNINTFAKDLHWKSMIFIFFLLSLLFACCHRTPYKFGSSPSTQHFLANPVDYRSLVLHNQNNCLRTVK